MRFQKANKILYNPTYDVQSNYAIWLPDWLDSHLGSGEIIIKYFLMMFKPLPAMKK